MPAPMPVGAPVKSKAGLIGLVGVLIGFLVGYGMGRVTVGTASPMMNFGKGSYNEGYAAAVKKAHEVGLVRPAPTDIRSIGGTVKSVTSGSLTVETSSTLIDPLNELKLPAERTVAVGSNVKIVRRTPLSIKDRQKAEVDFQKAIQNRKEGDPVIAAPVFYTEESTKLSDIKAGNLVTVAADHNILGEASFTATEVMVGETVSVPATPAPAPVPAKPLGLPVMPPAGSIPSSGQPPSKK